MTTVKALILLILLDFLGEIDLSLALSLDAAIDRGTFLKQSATISSSTLSLTRQQKDEENNQSLDHTVDNNNDDANQKELFKNLFESKNLSWNTDEQVSWSKLRYSTSSLMQQEEQKTRPLTLERLPPFPHWVEGYWRVSMMFKGASFPQGRDKLTIRVPGAGLGTCLSIPNVGYSPAPFSYHYFRDQNTSGSCYEDVAYNLPRRFEAFWPKAKVNSIQTRGMQNNLTPPCLVTGEGCNPEDNPNLHSSFNTRALMEFQGPTRSGGFAVQSIDMSMVDSTISASSANIDDCYISSRNYAQLNIQQELQTCFRECMYLKRQPTQGLTDNKISNTDLIEGRVRVGAFLPTFNANVVGYNDSLSVALYDYTIKMESISKEEAAAI